MNALTSLLNNYFYDSKQPWRLSDREILRTRVRERLDTEY